MAKWENMSADEKATHLRDEMNRVIDFLNAVSLRVGDLEKLIASLASTASAQTPNP